MILTYENKITESEILARTQKADLVRLSKKLSRNMLIHGENLEVMRTLIEDYALAGKVDLVYIDPPFATNALFKISEDRANTISMSNEDDIAYSDVLLGSDYLEFVRHRLVFLKELMSERGSIYLHIDYKIGHYVKILMDEVFGRNNFRSDITRIKCNPKNFARKAFGNIKDMVLFYSKTDKAIWNDPKTPFSEEAIDRLFTKVDKDGRKYTTIPLHAPGETANGKTGQTWKGVKPPKGRHWRSDPALLDDLDKNGLIEWSSNNVPRKKIYADEREGKRVQDIWEYKDPQYPVYPTEKNLDLLKFITSTSSDESGLVLDCFCGSGTTLVAANELGRNWIGIDNSDHAIRVTKKRLSEATIDLFSGSEYELLKQLKPSETVKGSKSSY